MALGVVFLAGMLVGGLTAKYDHAQSVAAAPISKAVTPSISPAASPTATETAAPAATLVVDEGEMYLRPTTTTSLPAGKIEFRVTNQGALHHEFVIVSGDPTGTVGDEPATVSEANHIGGQNGPEIGDLHPGRTKTMTAALAPGTYTAMCNYPSHFVAGMHFQFVVR